MAKKCFLTSLKAKKVWLKPPMLPAQKVLKLKAVNTLQIGETSALDGDDEDEVDDPPDQSLMMLTRMTTKKKTRPNLKKNNTKDEKIADEVEVEDEVEAEEEVEEEAAEDEVVIEVATKEAIETKKITPTKITTPRITMPMVNRHKVMPVDLKPGEAVNDHEALIGAEAEEEAEDEDEAEDEAEATTNLRMLLQKPKLRLKTKPLLFDAYDNAKVASDHSKAMKLQIQKNNNILNL